MTDLAEVYNSVTFRGVWTLSVQGVGMDNKTGIGRYDDDNEMNDNNDDRR